MGQKLANNNDEYKLHERSRRKSQGIRNLHHFRYELFNNIIDMQLTEMDDHFTETSTELLLCVACLSPNDFFSTFNKEKLMRLALFYPSEFSIVDLMVLGDQLDMYIIDLCGDVEFSSIEVAIAIMKRVFFAMHIVKSRLRNRIGDKCMNDNLVVYIENDIFDKIDNEANEARNGGKMMVHAGGEGCVCEEGLIRQEGGWNFWV
ncbi:uncharacterized protein [Populus alba]|uniref:uncharacterized protein n=1 Tax=Populus alba TaxID=43335 RepID=UPI003CC6FB4D